MLEVAGAGRAGGGGVNIEGVMAGEDLNRNEGVHNLLCGGAIQIEREATKRRRK